MSGLFDGLEVGKRALATYQLWLNTIGHNIANVNTPGYTRQRVTTTTTYPHDHPVGQVGTGVTAVDIHHIRDLFLNQQIRQEGSALGRWTASQKTIGQIEALFAEPNADSLGDLLNQFWNSWSELSNNPESLAARNAIKEQTNLLTSAFHRLHRQVNDLRHSIDAELTQIVGNINQMTEEIASLNGEIARTELGTAKANDLRDKRDHIIEQLSQYVDVNVREQKSGAATVYFGALAVVDGTTAFALDTHSQQDDDMRVSQIVWQGSKRNLKITGGKIEGLTEVRDEVIPRYLAALDDIARALVENVNAAHRAGTGLEGSSGIDFFDPRYATAGNITLNLEIENNVSRIAASLSGETGDNANALAIAALKDSALMSRGTATINDYYNSLVGRLGIETGKAQSSKENYELLVAQLENARQSVQGVSLDEEMTQMIKFQHAYDAAARVITTMDQALETVIHRMGVVGT